MSGEVRQLPRGRHGLSREQVRGSQRERMLAAIADAVAEKGFARVTVADVLAGAGVSRETFYEQFADKEDCFLAALDAGADVTLALIRHAVTQPAADRFDRLGHVLDAYLGMMAAQPTLARAFLIGAYGAGPAATRRRIDLQQRFVDAIAEVLDAGCDRFACEALVAAVSQIATARVGSGRAGELPGLRDELIVLVERLFPPLEHPRAERARRAVR